MKPSRQQIGLLMISIVMVQFLGRVCGDVSTEGEHWTKMDSDAGSYELKSIGTEWISNNILVCISECRRRFYTTCHSVQFTQDTGQCFPGNWLLKDELIISNDNGVPNPSTLFFVSQSGLCDIGGGFTFHPDVGNGVCMWVSSSYKNYDSAKEECSRLDSIVFMTETLEKVNLLRQTFPGSGKSMYIGLTDEFDNETHYWSNGQPLLSGQPSFWSDNEPDRIDQRCVLLHKRSVWYDFSCTHVAPFACERRLN